MCYTTQLTLKKKKLSLVNLTYRWALEGTGFSLKRWEVWCKGNSLLMAFKVEGPCDQEYGWLLGAESGPQLMAARKWSPQSYNHEEWNSVNKLTELTSGSFPRIARWEPDWLMPWYPPQKTMNRKPIRDTLKLLIHRNYDFVNGCCFKSLCLFMAICEALIGNLYRFMLICWGQTQMGWERRHGEAWEERMMFISLRASYIWCLTLRMTNCSSLPDPEGFQEWSWENKGSWSLYKLDELLCEGSNEIWWQEGIAYFYSVSSGNTVLLWPTKPSYFRSTYINVIVVEPLIEAVLRSSSDVTASSRFKWGISESNYMKIKYKDRDTSRTSQN